MLSKEAYDKFMKNIQKQIDDLDSQNKQKAESSLQAVFDEYRKRVSDRIAHEEKLALSSRKAGNIDAAKYHEMMSGIFQTILDNTPVYNHTL